MVTIFNRKKLLTDTSAEQLVNTKSKLDRAGITYFVKTKTSRSALGRGIDARIIMRTPTMYRVDPPVTYVYYLYVKRKEYERAKQVADM